MIAEGIPPSYFVFLPIYGPGPLACCPPGHRTQRPTDRSFVNLIAAIAAAEKVQGLHTLDRLSKDILQRVVRADTLQQKIRVSDIIRDGNSTFPTVINHQRNLGEEGWITQSEDPDNRRVILLHIKPQTLCMRRRWT